MSLMRALAASIFFCSAFALAQVQAAPVASPSDSSAIASTEITPLGTWNFAQKPGAEFSLTRDSNDPSASTISADRIARLLPLMKFDPNSQNLTFHLFPNGHVEGRVEDNVCYFIRSYQVARDRRDSDAVHPVRVSTCLPGNQVHLKSTEIRH
ncbi:MAG TPA: hypothetical protein VKV39_11345 [Candidatus Sulfotelmatobacter sp.]|nr:hypothetical protein [Candidatus Sulfotelmatobacter sp.]